jgi:hypothetical protein
MQQTTGGSVLHRRYYENLCALREAGTPAEKGGSNFPWMLLVLTFQGAASGSTHSDALADTL